MKDFESLTEHGRLQRYRRALTQALEAYPLRVRSLRFVSLQSKPVYRVYADSGCYAARFHNPKEHSLSHMISEMRFLNHLSGHSELCIEKPLANTQGEYVTEIKRSWLPEPAHVALCTWVPGRQLKDWFSVRSYRYLGRCSALFHKISASFRPGRDFSVLTNNRVFYWDEETILSRQDSRLLPKHRQSLFRKGAQLAEAAIRKIWRCGKPIIIHNDLHPSNVKVYRGSLSLYDFEDITWGFPEHDVGTAMYHVRFRSNYAELLSAFREGYEQVLHWPFNSGRQLDRFIMARLLMFANYVVNFSISPAKYLPRFETKLGKLLTEKSS
jgi:Ser/Thr protein kinase RdoA (MazF antagonist)